MLYLVKKYFSLHNDKFDQYVICPKCGSLYAINECVQTSDTGELMPKLQLCNHTTAAARVAVRPSVLVTVKC